MRKELRLLIPTEFKPVVTWDWSQQKSQCAERSAKIYVVT